LESAPGDPAGIGPEIAVKALALDEVNRIPRHESLAVRVHHHGLGVVVGEWVIAAGLDDPSGNLRDFVIFGMPTGAMRGAP